MNHFEKDLWNKLSGFSIDAPNQAFTFSDRLARDNGWTKEYALQVIEEYKKFLFLSTITTTGVTPSDAVDQAWHLHLTYTRSYWTDLCANILAKQIQHNPTQGGAAEASKYLDYYEETLAQYRKKFGAAPPENIWPDSRQRFSDIDFVRINKRTNWVIPKEVIAKWAPLAIVILFLLMWVLYFSVPASQPFALISIAVIIGVAIYYATNNRNSTAKDANSGTGSGAGCGGGCAAADSGCASGCSGCAAGGCSGCSGGGGD